MTVLLASATYVKRYKMEVDLRDVPPPVLPSGFTLVAWEPALLDAHADVLYYSFQQEIDAEVFPSFADRTGCYCLMNELSRKPGFLPAATWLLTGPEGSIGSVQGLCGHGGVGAIQNLGVVPGARGRGLGTQLLLQALHGFRDAGLLRGMLEVTARNEGAIRLYRRLGFRCHRTIYKAIN